MYRVDRIQPFPLIMDLIANKNILKEIIRKWTLKKLQLASIRSILCTASENPSVI